MQKTIELNPQAARAAPTIQTQGAPNNEAPKRRRPTPRERLILFAIGNREMYGLEIQRAIADCSDGAETITIGSLYPTLHSLEQKGLVASRMGEDVTEERCGARRKYYHLSEAGKQALNQILDFQNRLLSWQRSPLP
jgi:DNA-binding PadR family transcriptional regulator